MKISIKMKKIIVFGANGGTGKEVVKQALEMGYEVTAVVRNLNTFNQTHPFLNIIKGDVLQRENFEKKVIGKDAVISCIGSGSTKPTTIYSIGIENIITAMNATAVKRLMCISAGGLDVNPLNNFIMRILTKNILQRILKEPYNDMRLMEQEVRASELNYTIVRPPRLINKPLTGIYRAKLNDNLKNTGSLARTDLAHYIVHHLEDTNTFKSTAHLSY